MATREMRTLRILLLILLCYLGGWITADLLVPHVLASRQQAAQQRTEQLAKNSDVARP